MGAHNELTIEGLTELRDALRKLPDDLAHEANVIVQAHAERAAQLMDAQYAQHEVTGNLRNSLTVSNENAYFRFGARWVVKNTAPHAWWAENGTQMRQTLNPNVPFGPKKGAMKPLHIFIPIAQQQRRLMVHALIGVVNKAGMYVSVNEII